MSGTAEYFLGATMLQAEERTAAGGRVAVFTTPERARTGPNQDAAAIFPLGDDRAVLAVADGVGGLPSGDEAAGIALRELGRSLAKADPGAPDLRSAILTGLENAHQAVQVRGGGGATTLAAVEILGGQVRPFHVGDSIVAVFGQRGRRKMATMSHSPVGYAVESGLLDENEALHHEERHLISNAVGLSGMRIEIGPRIPLAARDTVVLATDGLTDNLFMDEIVEHLRRGPLGRSATLLAARCLARMEGQTGQPSKPDDVTLIAYRPDPKARGRARKA